MHNKALDISNTGVLQYTHVLQRSLSMSTPTPHPFSFTLGDGPYRFVRLVSIQMNETFGTRVNGRTDDVEAGIGSCAHCGHAIMDCYIIQIGNGKKYGVGSDCIGRLHLPAPVLTAVQKAKRESDRKKRDAREEKNQVKYFGLFNDFLNANKEKIALLPHPSKYFSEQGRSLVDWALFVMKPKSSSKSLRANLNYVRLQLGMDKI